MTFRRVLTGMYAASAAAVLYFLITGWVYYMLPLIQRPRADGHALLKPGGMVGHTLGIVGSLLLVSLFSYSLRKRRKLGLRKGRLSRWLDVHIWMGITGPALITLHSAFKFNGIVTVSYASMMAVMISGFIGRYIYMQIPRDDRGAAMNAAAAEERIAMLNLELKERYRVSEAVIQEVDRHFPSAPAGSRAGVWPTLKNAIRYDLTRPLRKMRLRRFLSAQGDAVPAELVSEVVRLSVQRATLARRREMLGAMSSLLHLWHVVHKPFAYVMILVMIIHIIVVAAMGYTWIF